MASSSARRRQNAGSDGLPRRRVIRPAILTYMADTADPVLPRRLAQQSSLPNTERQQGGNHPRPLRSTTGTSMLVSGSEYTSIHDLAALTTTSRITASESEPSSFGARQLDKSSQRLLAEGEDGVLVIGCTRAEGNLECPFNFLFCLKTFARMEDWVKHSMTHFRNARPPDSSRCCFCDASFQSSPEESSWAKRMAHIACHHQLGSRLAHGRPDFELYRYLWNKHLISDIEYRDLMGNHASRSQAYPSPPDSPEENAYTDMYSESQERRARGRQS